MQVTIRVLAISDVPEVVEGWNSSVIHSQLSRERFENVILKDPNYEEGSALVATLDGKIVGFICVVAREGILGADKRGRPDEQDYGYLKGIFVLAFISALC